MINSLCFSPNGKILINSSGYTKGQTEVWSLIDKKPLYILPTYSTSAAISPDGQTVALGTGGADKIVAIYDLNKQCLLNELEGHSHGINDLTFSSDGSTLISGSGDGEIRIWQPLAKSSTQPNPKSQTVNLKTAEMDYTKLMNLLAAGEWWRADEETTRIVRIVGKADEYSFKLSDIYNFPHEDLCIINQLWQKYSNGRFGFLVQKRIYQSLGGNRQNINDIYDAFCEHLGWKMPASSFYDETDYSFNVRNVPEGYFPTMENWQGAGEFLGRFLVHHDHQ